MTNTEIVLKLIKLQEEAREMYDLAHDLAMALYSHKNEIDKVMHSFAKYEEENV